MPDYILNKHCLMASTLHRRNVCNKGRQIFLTGNMYRRGARRWRKLYRINGHLFQAKRFSRVSRYLSRDMRLPTMWYMLPAKASDQPAIPGFALEFIFLSPPFSPIRFFLCHFLKPRARFLAIFRQKKSQVLGHFSQKESPVFNNLNSGGLFYTH